MARADTPQEIDFRPVAEADYPMLFTWRSQPHVRQFYQKAEPTLEGVAAKYGPVIRGETPVVAHIAMLEGRPFGCLQSYRNADHPEYAAAMGHEDGISIDLYIGETGDAGRGLGRAMLASYLRKVAFPHFADQPVCYIAHETANHAGLACSKAVGFTPIGAFVEDGCDMVLLRTWRAA